MGLEWREVVGVMGGFLRGRDSAELGRCKSGQGVAPSRLVERRLGELSLSHDSYRATSFFLQILRHLSQLRCLYRNHS